MNEEKSSTIQSVNSPLGFFSLALLTVEGFLGIVLIFAKDPHSANLSTYGMWIGAGLFVIVVSIVAVLTWYKPDALGLSGKDIHDIKTHENELQARQSSLPVEPIESIVADSPQEKLEFENLEKFLVWNSQYALKWFADQVHPVRENLFFAAYPLPYPPEIYSKENTLNEKAAVLSALKGQGLLEDDTDSKLKVSDKGKRFIKFIGF
jgi:hypothetical protein